MFFLIKPLSRVVLWGTAIVLLSTNMLQAQTPMVYDQISISASAEREIENDELVAVVYAQADAQRQAEAADEVNTAIRWALDRAERVRNVTTQTLQYSSFPVYGDNRRIVGWQARQSLRLTSGDAERLSELIGELQARVAVESISYQVSRDAREAADDELIAEALERFTHRAEQVAEALGRSGYRIVRIDINTGGSRPMPMAFRSAAVSEMAMDRVQAPALEAGTQTVQVSISGTIELNIAR